KNDILYLMEYTPDNKFLVYETNGVINFFNLKAQKVTQKIKTLNSWPKKFEFDYASRYIAVAYLDKAIVWDIKSCKKMKSVSLTGDSIETISISPDGKYIAISWLESLISLIKI
ncbi:MAG: hypothetical protein ACK4IX_13490, partial [Candidatus Sericytochromatia bacterium]